MGLDMHLIRAPRLDDVTIQQINAAEGWFSYERRPEKYKSSTPEEWCGVSREDLPSEKVMETLRPYYVERFASWDTGHNYPDNAITQRFPTGERQTRFTDGLSPMFKMAKTTVITMRNARKASSKSC